MWEDVISAVLDFFNTEKLLKEVNSTTITLIPKSKCPTNVSEFRPISCCNVLYKCITKVLSYRLGRILRDIIDENQGGFSQGIYIVHDILII